MSAEMGPVVKQRILQAGVFPTDPIPRDAISERILGRIRADHAAEDLGIQEELVARRFSSAAVAAAAVALLRPEVPMNPPVQYQVFSLSKHRLSLINFNNDGLADRYCSQHLVVNVHGTSLSATTRARLNWEQTIDYLQEFPELRGPKIPTLLLPQREPSEIRLTAEYSVMQRHISAAERLIVIGYSFGDMDDHVAYDLVTSTIRASRIPTVIAKPMPTDLIVRISEDAASKTVFGLSAFWDKLASATMASISRPQYKTCNHALLCRRCVAYLYEAFLDQGTKAPV
jgi:hypothetical protein